MRHDRPFSLTLPFRNVERVIDGIVKGCMWCKSKRINPIRRTEQKGRSFIDCISNFEFELRIVVNLS